MVWWYIGVHNITYLVIYNYLCVTAVSLTEYRFVTKNSKMSEIVGPLFTIYMENPFGLKLC